MIDGRPEHELSHFSTAAQSELFDKKFRNDPAQIKKMPGAFKPPRSPAPRRYTCVRDPSEAALGSFHLRLASSPVSASA